ncbi:MAG TPA: serine hydrolase [Xanthobacteraceae bacterium]|jgi:CubicO group peptidase (beta-lactamase class C family)
MRLAPLVITWLFAGTALAAGTPWPTASWQTSTPEEQGMSSRALASLIDTVGTQKQDSLLIVRHGIIVAEAYYAPYRSGIPHDLRSVTKSVIGTLTAIEVSEGLLDGTNHPVLGLFADKQIANVDDNKKAMTVQNLLDMTSGIMWEEKDYTPGETLMRMYDAPDRTASVLDQPMSDPPGTKFYYDSGDPYVLSAIITRKTGKNAWDYAKEKLFGPLGILTERWREPDTQGVTDGEAGLSLEPRDMLKIGYLYLHEGMWDAQQIIPASWVAYAEAGKVPASSGRHYGNLWWSMPGKDALMALGRHSQWILVLPKYDIVAAMTGYMPDHEYYPIYRLIDDIVAAVRSDDALPPDPIGQSTLAASSAAAANERALPVVGTPGLQLAGRTYRLDENRFHITTLTLRLTGEEPMWVLATSNDNPGDSTQYFPTPLGLDGRFRLAAQTPFGIAATRGRWVSDSSLEVERRILGASVTQRWLLTFQGNDVTVHFADTDGRNTNLHGRAD